MKCILFFSLALTLLAFAPSNRKSFVPPGTVRINDSLYMDVTEVSNRAWQEYESWTKQKYGANSPEHVAVLPDTLVWRSPQSFNEPYVEYYYRHPAYHDFPVVGVSYEQAVAYCQWRTARVKEAMAAHKKPALKLEYRLPSKAEWERCCGNGDLIFSNNGVNAKQVPLCNVRRPANSQSNPHPPYPDVTCPVKMYPLSAFKLCNMIGNVAEMLNTKGISKGGSWQNTLDQCRPEKDIAYTQAESWLGFRCVVSIKN